MYIFVLPRHKIGKAHGYDHFSFFFYVRLNLTVKSRHAIMASFKTLFLQNRYKLVAAGTELSQINLLAAQMYSSPALCP